MAIVLSGVAVSSFIGAITDTILTLKPDTLIARAAFIIGVFPALQWIGLFLPVYLLFLPSLLP